MQNELGSIRRNIECHLKVFLENILHHKYIVTFLKTKNAIKSTEEEYILVQSGILAQKLNLLNTVKEGDDKCLGIFVSVLKETHQAHLAAVLEGEGTDHLMAPEHKAALSDNTPTLMADMESDFLLDCLQSSGALSRYDVESINQIASPSKRNAMLLKIIACKPDDAFGKLVCALVKTNQAHLAKRLQQALVDAEKRACDEKKTETKRQDITPKEKAASSKTNIMQNGTNMCEPINAATNKKVKEGMGKLAERRVNPYRRCKDKTSPYQQGK